MYIVILETWQVYEKTKILISFSQLISDDVLKHLASTHRLIETQVVAVVKEIGIRNLHF